MMETWKPMKGYEKRYEISDRGRVKSYLSRNGSGIIEKPHLRKLNKDNHGYLIIGLYSENGCQTRKIHSLVMENFRGNRPSGFEIDHKNGRKNDNRIENLEYVSQRVNTQRAKARLKSSSKYMGVSWFKRDKCWRVGVGRNGKWIQIMLCNSEIFSSVAYQIMNFVVDETDEIFNATLESVRAQFGIPYQRFVRKTVKA